MCCVLWWCHVGSSFAFFHEGKPTTTPCTSLTWLLYWSCTRAHSGGNRFLASSQGWALRFGWVQVTRCLFECAHNLTKQPYLRNKNLSLGGNRRCPQPLKVDRNNKQTHCQCEDFSQREVEPSPLFLITKMCLQRKGDATSSMTGSMQSFSQPERTSATLSDCVPWQASTPPGKPHVPKAFCCMRAGKTYRGQSDLYTIRSPLSRWSS